MTRRVRTFFFSGAAVAAVASFAGACGFDALPGSATDASTNGDESTVVDEVGAKDTGDATSEPADSAVASVKCAGNTDGYEKGAPWPLGARCPTRINVGAFPTPGAVSTLWNHTISGMGYFGHAVVTSDETVVATYAQNQDGGGFAAKMVALRYDRAAGFVRVLWDIPLPGESFAGRISPAIAASGEIYIAGEKSFAVFSRNGNLLRSFPIVGAPLGSSPLILASGNVVVKGKNTIYAFNATGEVWKYALPGNNAGFVGELVADGLLSLYVGARISGAVGGQIVKLSEAGAELAIIPTHASPIGTPTMIGANLYAPLKAALIGISSTGSEFFRGSTKALGVQMFGVAHPDTLYYFNDGPYPSMALTISNGKIADLNEPSGNVAVVGTASEDLVYVDAVSTGNDPGSYITAMKKDGSVRWTHKLTTDGTPEAQAIAVGGTGILYVGAHQSFYAVGHPSQLR